MVEEGAYSSAIWNDGAPNYRRESKNCTGKKTKNTIPPLYINDERSLPLERSEKFPSSR